MEINKTKHKCLCGKELEHTKEKNPHWYHVDPFKWGSSQSKGHVEKKTVCALCDVMLLCIQFGNA